MSNVLEQQFWDSISRITHIRVIPQGLMFVGTRQGNDSAPAVLLDPSLESAQCVALLNDFNGRLFDRTDLARLDMASRQLAALYATHPSPTIKNSEMAAAQRNLAHLHARIESILRPKPTIHLLTK